MPLEPLQPFVLPSLRFAPASTYSAIVWLLVVALAFWLVYTVVAVYHWFTYSHNSRIKIPAIAVHLVISTLLIAFALPGLL